MHRGSSHPLGLQPIPPPSGGYASGVGTPLAGFSPRSAGGGTPRAYGSLPSSPRKLGASPRSSLATPLLSGTASPQGSIAGWRGQSPALGALREMPEPRAAID